MERSYQRWREAIRTGRDEGEQLQGEALAGGWELLDVGGGKWQGEITSGAERSQVKKSNQRWTGAIRGGGEAKRKESQMDRSNQRRRRAIRGGGTGGEQK